MAFTWINNIKDNFGQGGSHLSGQGTDSLKAILEEIRNKMDELADEVGLGVVTTTTEEVTTTTSAA
jgi:hypothetical protein